MKTTIKILLILALLFSSCAEEKLVPLSTEEIEGVVSYKEVYYYTEKIYGIRVFSYYLYIQSPTNTISIEVTPQTHEKYKIGDSISVIIQKYKVNEN